MDVWLSERASNWSITWHIPYALYARLNIKIKLNLYWCFAAAAVAVAIAATVVVYFKSSLFAHVSNAAYSFEAYNIARWMGNTCTTT